MKVNAVKRINLTAPTSTPVTVDLESDVQCYYIYGTRALVADFAISPTGTPVDGMEVWFDYNATVTMTTAVHAYGDYSLTIFTYRIPYTQLAKKMQILCKYNNGGWAVYLLFAMDTVTTGYPTYGIGFDMLDGSCVDNSTLAIDGTTYKLIVKSTGITATQLASNAVTTAKILNANVTLDKIVGLTRGYLIVGDSGGRPSELNAKTSAQILIGNGTDLISVAMTGDVTITNAGVMAIGAAKVLSAMIKSGELVNAHINAAAAIEYSKLALTGAILNADLAGSIAWSKLAAGTASQIVSTDGSGNLQTLTTATYPSLTELAFLKGATSNLQTQLTTMAAKKISSSGVITTTTIITAATLKDVTIVDTSGGGFTTTLPLISTITDGTTITLQQYSANAATIACNAGDTGFVDNLGADQATITIGGAGKSVVLRADAGAKEWVTVMAT